MRVCLDLNIWCADLLARANGRDGTACQTLVDAVRGVGSGPRLQLVISWGMLDRLGDVVQREFGYDPEDAERLKSLLADYAETGPGLALGGVGVIPIHDPEDRHVLETAWAGRADVLVTADFSGFAIPDAEVRVAGRTARLTRGDRRLWIVHPFDLSAWLRGVGIDGLEDLERR